jgi:hypothetical protein
MTQLNAIVSRLHGFSVASKKGRYHPFHWEDSDWGTNAEKDGNLRTRRTCIDIQGFERPETTEEDDANWLVAKCKIVASEFSCDLRLSLVTHEFTPFLAGLEKAARSRKGTATFRTLE